MREIERTVRGEPFVWVIGRLAKDDGSLNVIAEEVRPLKLRNAPAFADSSPVPAPYSFLRSLRQNAPESKDWG